MSERDEKLRDTLNKLAIHIDRGDSAAAYNYMDEINEAIAQIEQIFADEGWLPIKPSPSDSFTIKALPTHANLMTGQEWYDRFEKHYKDLAIYPEPNPLKLVMESQAIRAAKRAAGLSDE